jgi:hypothetical protein
MPRWRVDYLGKKTTHLGTVGASDEKAAIAEAMKAFHITPARLFKLAVTRTRIEERKRGMKAPAARNGTYATGASPDAGVSDMAPRRDRGNSAQSLLVLLGSDLFPAFNQGRDPLQYYFQAWEIVFKVCHFILHRQVDGRNSPPRPGRPRPGTRNAARPSAYLLS